MSTPVAARIIGLALLCPAISTGTPMPRTSAWATRAASGVWESEIVVPVVLTASGLGGSFFTTELTLTNRGATDATVELFYTPASGGATVVAEDRLAAGRQKTVASAIDYLISLGANLPASGNRSGSLRLRFGGLSAPTAAAATARTTTAVAQGRAGLSYAAVAPSPGAGPVYLFGLRQTPSDRSNLALVNLGSEADGSATLRVTVTSGDPSGPASKVLPDITLGPGGFKQIDGILASNGLSLTNGYAKVERVSGSAPVYAYAVINDQGTSDGSFVPPVLASALSGKRGATLPVAVEAGPFTTEVVVTNFGTASRSARLTYVASAMQAVGNAASLDVTLAPGEQKVYPSFVQALRDARVAGVGPAGATFAGAVFLTVPGGDVSGLFLGARTSAPGGGGRFGVFYTGVPFGNGANDSAWLYGLQQDDENRTNLAIVSTGEVDASPSTFRVEVYDGATGALAGTVPVTLAARGWTQIGSIVARVSPAVRTAYARVTRTSGSNPFVAYAVVNDGAAPGQRSDDGAFIAMDVSEESGAIPVRLERISDGPGTASFGLPLRPGLVTDVSQIRVTSAGTELDARVKPLLYDYDRNAQPSSLRAVLIQVPTRLARGERQTLTVTVAGGGAGPASSVTPFAQLSAESVETARVVDRTIVGSAGTYRLQESNPRDRTLFLGREPNVIAHFPPGYLARSGILGTQTTAPDATADVDRAGLLYLSQAIAPFVRSAYYEETYALNPDPESVVDPVENYEGWLYDRCATYLTAYSHVGDPAMLRHALRTCSYYGSKIVLSGESRGIFSGKPDPDPKYSHQRGLYAYYALTGDEGALAAGRAIADMWASEPLTIGPYRQGHLRGPDKLWTERILGTGMEGTFYGFRLTGERAYLSAFQELLSTAYRHITTSSQAELVSINVDPNTPPFPPQNCFVHNALQHAEGDASQPWCSGWMSELLIDSLLGYQEQTDDARVDEIFVRLARFLRDVGSSYFRGDPRPDFFLKPSLCWGSQDDEDPRILIPLYGSGLFADGSRGNYGDYSDFEHCTDATALTAAALRALKRQGKYDQGGPIGPFASEGASLLQLHHEFAFCSLYTFRYDTRTRRDPAVWTSADLAAGASSPASFILENKIGFPSHPSNPQRKVSWWFNTSMLQFGLLREAGIAIPKLEPGKIQPAGQSCPAP